MYGKRCEECEISWYTCNFIKKDFTNCEEDNIKKNEDNIFDVKWTLKDYNRIKMNNSIGINYT